MRWRTLLLPDPLGPVRAGKGPRRTIDETSLTAVTFVAPLPKVFVTCRSSIIRHHAADIAPAAPARPHPATPLRAHAQRHAIDEKIGDEGT